MFHTIDGHEVWFDVQNPIFEALDNGTLQIYRYDVDNNDNTKDTV